MKKISFSLPFTWIMIILMGNSCKKEKPDNPNPSPSVQVNHAPVVNAGNDTSIYITACGEIPVMELKGSFYDPDPKSPDNQYYLIEKYKWTKIFGPDECDLTHLPRIWFFKSGQYGLELMAVDGGGLISRDTVVINVTLNPRPFEINLDTTFSTGYVYRDNYLYCYDDPFSGYVCEYADMTEIQKEFNLSSTGPVKFWIREYLDTLATVYTNSGNDATQMGIYADDGIPGYKDYSHVFGICSIQFKKLIRSGGGSFNGTCIWGFGSATDGFCASSNIFNGMAPLSVSGSLDTTAHKISLTLKGKLYF
jgi:hypothetical protein